MKNNIVNKINNKKILKDFGGKLADDIQAKSAADDTNSVNQKLGVATPPVYSILNSLTEGKTSFIVRPDGEKIDSSQYVNKTIHQTKSGLIIALDAKNEAIYQQLPPNALQHFESKLAQLEKENVETAKNVASYLKENHKISELVKLYQDASSENPGLDKIISDKYQEIHIVQPQKNIIEATKYYLKDLGKQLNNNKNNDTQKINDDFINKMNEDMKNLQNIENKLDAEVMKKVNAEPNTLEMQQGEPQKTIENTATTLEEKQANSGETAHPNMHNFKLGALGIGEDTPIANNANNSGNNDLYKDITTTDSSNDYANIFNDLHKAADGTTGENHH